MASSLPNSNPVRSVVGEILRREEARRLAEAQRLCREQRLTLTRINDLAARPSRDLAGSIGRGRTLSDQALFMQRMRPELTNVRPLMGPSVRQLSGPTIRQLTGPTIRQLTGPTIRQLSGPTLRKLAGASVSEMAAPLLRNVARDNVRALSRPMIASDVARVLTERPWATSRGLRVFDSDREQQDFLARIYQFPAAPEFRPRVAPANPLPTSDEVLDEFIDEIESYLARSCPLALRRLHGARAAIRRGDPESLAQSATSCRRTLEAVADAVYPERGEIVVMSRTFGPLEITTQHYRNRLVLFFEHDATSRSLRQMQVRQLDYLIELLAPLIRRAGRGVHGEVDPLEARRIYTTTLQVLAEVARHDGH